MMNEDANEEIRNFQIAYHMLTKKQARIFDYLHWFSKNYQVVCPSQSTIAKVTGCSRDTVIQAIQKSRELGLVCTVKLRSGWSSFIYLIKEDILKLDLTKADSWFMPQSSANQKSSPEKRKQNNSTQKQLISSR